MTDPLLTRPEFQEAVEAAMDAGDGGRTTAITDFTLVVRAFQEGRVPLLALREAKRKMVAAILTAALPHLRRALAEELRKEAEREGAHDSISAARFGGILDAADHLTRQEVMG